MKGKFVSSTSDSITLSDDKGANKVHDLAPSPSITLNGQSATMAELRLGDEVTLSGDPATSVSATRK